MRFMPIEIRREIAFRVRLSARRAFAIVELACVVAITASAVLANDSVYSELLQSEERQIPGIFEEYLEEYDDVFAPSESNEIKSTYEPISLEDFCSLDSLAPPEKSKVGQTLAELGEFNDGFAERAESGETKVAYNGSSIAASHDVIIRGSVNLPSIKAIQFWGNGYFGSGHVSPVGWNGRVKENNSGATLGINLPLGIGTISGYYNYHRNRASYYKRCIQQEDDGIGMAFYANVGGFYMTALGMYGDDGYTAYDTTRQIRHTYIGGYQSTGFFETGYEMATLGMFVLKPFGSYQYTNLKHGNFNTDTLVQRAGKRKYNSCLMTLGSRVDLNLAGLDVFTLEGRMAWVTQLRSKNESIQSFCYGRVPGTVSLSQPYFHGNGAGSDFFWGGVGLRLSLMGMLSVSADYDCLVNKYQTLNEGSIGLLFGF